MSETDRQELQQSQPLSSEKQLVEGEEGEVAEEEASVSIDDESDSLTTSTSSNSLADDALLTGPDGLQESYPTEAQQMLENSFGKHATENPGFEGPEKKLEIDFTTDFLEETPRGLREVPRETWDSILESANCSILSVMSNESWDSYVLSESSLFVSSAKIVLKTCGTTTLLNTVPHILEAISALNTSVQFIFYSRKNFLFPIEQLYPHTSFNDEVQYLNTFFDQGAAYILGPVTDDHWYLYVADYTEQEIIVTDQVLEIMMTDLPRDVMNMFFVDDQEKEQTNTSEDVERAEKVTKNSGIGDIMPGSTVDAFQFFPCGYSANGLRGDTYWTIHVTPEEACSYVSFETNLEIANYQSVIESVLRVFQPGQYTITLFCDEDSVVETAANGGLDKGIKEYALSHKTFYNFEGDYSCMMCNYSSVQKKKKKKAKRVNKAKLLKEEAER